MSNNIYSRARMGSEKGLTLIEVLVVMLIMSILASVGGYAFLSYERGARDKEAQAQLVSAHTVLMAAYDKGHDHETDLTSQIARLESKSKDLKGFSASEGAQTISSALAKNPRNIWIEVPNPQDLILCNQSKTGRAYCLRTDTEGIRVKTVSDDELWAREIRSTSYKNSSGEDEGPQVALTKIKGDTVQRKDLGWQASGRDGGELTREYVVPTIRLDCDIIEGGVQGCPSTQTSEDSAYFSWTVSTDIAAPTKVECQIDGRSLTSSEEKWSNEEDCVRILTNMETVADNKAALTAKPEEYAGLTAKDRLQAAIGQHELIVRATNGAGSSETTYNWTILPDIPVVTITSPNQFTECDADVHECYAPAQMRETTERSIVANWEANMPMASATGYIRNIYCKLELALPNGTYHSPAGWDGKTECEDLGLEVNSTPAGDPIYRSANGTISLPAALPEDWEKPWTDLNINLSPSTLPFHNQVPHRLSVIAVTQSGASTTRRFDWRVVDHTSPGSENNETEPTMVVSKTTEGENIKVSGSAAAGWNVCYSPYGIGGGPAVSRGARFNMTIHLGSDGISGDNSGLRDVVYPGINAAYIGSEGRYHSDITAHDLGYPRHYPNGHEPMTATYVFGSTGFDISQPHMVKQSGTHSAFVYNGAPPAYPRTEVTQLTMRRAVKPSVPEFSGGTTDSQTQGGNGWTNAGSVVFAISATDVLPAGACNTLAGYEYEYRFNGGPATIVPVAVGGAFSVSNEGYYQIRVRAVDDLGATSDWSSYRYAKMDRTPPSRPTHIMEGLLSGWAAEVGGNVENWTNQARRMYGANSVDSHPSGGTNYVSTLASYVCENSGGRYCPSSAGDFTVSAQGIYTACFKAIDRAGNESPCSSDRTAHIDTTPPSPPILGRSPASNDAEQGWHNASQDVAHAGGADSGGSGFWKNIASQGPCHSYDFANGERYCEMYSVDHAGNTSVVTGILLRKDTTPPTIGISGGTGGASWTKDIATARVTHTGPSDNAGGSGVLKTECEREYLDGSPDNAISRKVGTNCGTNPPEGESIIRFWAQDRAGNWGASGGRVTRLDTTRPVHNTSGFRVYRHGVKMQSSDALAWSYTAEKIQTSAGGPVDPIPPGVNKVSGLVHSGITLTDCGYDTGVAGKNTNGCTAPFSSESLLDADEGIYRWSRGAGDGTVEICHSGCGQQTRGVSIAPRLGVRPDDHEGVGGVVDNAGNFSSPLVVCRFQVDGTPRDAPTSLPTAKLFVKNVTWSGC